MHIWPFIRVKIHMKGQMCSCIIWKVQGKLLWVSNTLALWAWSMKLLVWYLFLASSNISDSHKKKCNVKTLLPFCFYWLISLTEKYFSELVYILFNNNVISIVFAAMLLTPYKTITFAWLFLLRKLLNLTI